MQLLADQAAVILESRALIDEATRVRAREEAARLRISVATATVTTATMTPAVAPQPGTLAGTPA